MSRTGFIGGKYCPGDQWCLWDLDVHMSDLPAWIVPLGDGIHGKNPVYSWLPYDGHRVRDHDSNRHLVRRFGKTTHPRYGTMMYAEVKMLRGEVHYINVWNSKPGASVGTLYCGVCCCRAHCSAEWLHRGWLCAGLRKRLQSLHARWHRL